MFYTLCPGCVQEKDLEDYENKYNEMMEEFEKRYDDTTMLLEDAQKRLLDEVSVWRQAWYQLADADKSPFCPPGHQLLSAPAKTGVLPIEEIPSSTSAEGCKLSKGVQTSTILVDRAASALDNGGGSKPGAPVPLEPPAPTRSAGGRDGAESNSIAARGGEEFCEDDCDDEAEEKEEEEASSNHKKWNCYTVFLKEHLDGVHLTKVVIRFTSHAERKE